MIDMKELILELMEQTLSAYTDEAIQEYFDRVQTEGLTEHGFPRLASNIGVLISHGRRSDLLPIFIQMFDFCCRTIPKVKAANDFSVREVISCLWEVEKSKIVPQETTEHWRSLLATIVPEECYDKYAVTVDDSVQNWALFTGVSEYFRQKAGLCDTRDFIEMQVVQQSRFFDENGMYRDDGLIKHCQPIVYDLVPRVLYSLMFDQGYRGKGYKTIDAILKKAGLLTLKMQSPNGEIPFGGRSNQFLHNEACIITICEYEAKRYYKEGDLALAAAFKAASFRAIEVTRLWLSKKPIRHIKNRFPTETKYGCEKYAYFDKYMITVASNLYNAYQICDETIPFEKEADLAPVAVQTSEFFPLLFLKSGGYGIELALEGANRYDAAGLGRVHRAGAPSTICMSCPCPGNPKYTVDITPVPLSACSAVETENGWSLGADGTATYEVTEKGTDEKKAFATLLCRFEEGTEIRETYEVEENGVSIGLTSQGEFGYVLPAFAFDGENETEIALEKNVLTVSYEGWVCRYTASGSISEFDRIGANRNGHYRSFLVKGEKAIQIKIEIEKQ